MLCIGYRKKACFDISISLYFYVDKALNLSIFHIITLVFWLFLTPHCSSFPTRCCPTKKMAYPRLENLTKFTKWWKGCLFCVMNVWGSGWVIFIFSICLGVRVVFNSLLENTGANILKFCSAVIMFNLQTKNDDLRTRQARARACLKCLFIYLYISFKQYIFIL